MTGLGLTVAVSGLEPGRGAPGGDRLGLQRLAGGDHAAQGGEGAQGGALGDHPVLGRRLAEHVDAERLDEVEPLDRIEAPVVDHRRGAGQPGRQEDVTCRLRPPGRRSAPGQLALARAKPVLGLPLLPEQIAVPMHHPPRLARSTRGKDDQRRVLGIHRFDRRWCLLRQILIERRADLIHGHRRHPIRQFSQQRVLTHAEPRISGSHPQRQVLPPQHRAAGQRHRPHPPAGQQGENPLNPVPNESHHHISPLHPPSSKRPREPRRLSNQFPEVPVPPIPFRINGHDPKPRSRRRLHELNEIHRRQSALPSRLLDRGS